MVHHSNDCYFCGMGVTFHCSNEGYLRDRAEVPSFV